MPIRLMENFRAVFYAPYYATLIGGFFAREGVEIELVTSQAPGDAVPKLLDGSIDITWGGPMRVMKTRDQDPNSPLVCFGEVVPHDPFYLIGKPGAKPFQLTDLPNRKFASVSEVPTPWLCLQQDLRDQGMDPAKLPRIAGRTMAQNYDALRAGEIDVMQAFEPYVSTALDDKAGEILYAAHTRGPTAYTSFIATREACERHRDAFAAMIRATANMLTWFYSRPSDDLAMAVLEYFPFVPGDILDRSIGRYHLAGLWSEKTEMKQKGFERLAKSLHSGGFISRIPTYEECVEPTLNAVKPNPPKPGENPNKSNKSKMQ